MRNTHLEARLLERVADAARDRLGLDCASYPHAVQARLELGAHRYGETFRDRPTVELVAEIKEEAEDLAAWSLLALQTLASHDHANPHVCDDLLHAALTGAAADFYARRAHQRLHDRGRP